MRVGACLLLAVSSLAGCSNRAGSNEAAMRAEAVTIDDCEAMGGAAIGLGMAGRLGDPAEDLGASDDCPGGRSLLGAIEAGSGDNGGLCCEVPMTVSAAECAALEGVALGDPGDGSSYVAGCEDGAELLGWANSCPPGGVCGEGGICCAAAPAVQTRTWMTWVNHYSVPCSGWEGKYMCNLVSDTRDGEWTIDYDGIFGTTLEWGHVYQVSVASMPSGGEGPDAPDTTVSVTEVLVDDVVPAGTTFSFPVDPAVPPGIPRSLELADAAQGKINEGPTFTCESEEICDGIATLLDGRATFEVEFVYTEDGTGLVAIRVVAEE